MIRLVLILALVLGVAACDAPNPPVDRVGRAVVQWDEESRDPLPQAATSEGTLLRDEAAWQAWLDTLSPEMVELKQQQLSAVSLEGAVVVVATWGRCTEEARIADLGGGRIAFQVINTDPSVVCAWTPMRVQVWQVPLTDLGVTAGEVELVS